MFSIRWPFVPRKTFVSRPREAREAREGREQRAVVMTGSMGGEKDRG